LKRLARVATFATIAALLVVSACTSKSSTTASAGSSGAASAGPVTVSAQASDGAHADLIAAKLSTYQAKPLKAAGDPVVIGYTNTEGDPGLSVPEDREGVQAALDFYNNQLGGVGGDPATGKVGRPLKLETCPHTLTPTEAQACGVRIAQAKPSVILVGIEPFTSVLAPAWTGIPVVNAVPIDPADFTTPGFFATGNGCAATAGDITQAIADGSKSIVYLTQQNGGAGEFCESFASKVVQAAQKDHPDLQYHAISFEAGLADLTAPLQSALDLHPDAITVPLADTDCNRVWKSLTQLGYTGRLYNAFTCQNSEFMDANKDFLTATQDRTTFRFEHFLTQRPDLLPAGSLERAELETQNALFDAANPGKTASYFRSQGFANGMFIANVIDAAAQTGTVDSASITAVLKTPTLHLFGSNAMTCGTLASKPSLCNLVGIMYRYNKDGFSLAKTENPIQLAPVLTKAGL
jgi:branched-chain amino acid transport system substrate-binding protein